MPIDGGRKALLTLSGLVIAFTLLGGVLGRSLAVEGTYSYLKLFNEVLYLIRNNYVEPVKDDTLMEGAYRGMLESLDSQSEYLTPEEYQRAVRNARNGDADPGVVVSKRRGYAVVVASRVGSPARKAGLDTGTILISIDGRSTLRMGAWEAAQALQGKSGTSVRLTVIRNSESKSEELVVERAVPKRSEPTGRLVEPGIGVLRIPDLRPGDAEQIRRTVAGLSGQGANRLLLDLRDNAGASVEEAIKVAGIFAGGATVARVKDRKSGTEELKAPGGAPWKGKLALLVDGGTAGASEVLAAALREKAGAAMVGEKTWGLATVQKIIGLPGGDGIRLSVGKYLSPSGKDWNGTGLDPDVTQAAGAADERGDPQLDRGLELLKKKSEERQAA